MVQSLPWPRTSDGVRLGVDLGRPAHEADPRHVRTSTPAAVEVRRLVASAVRSSGLTLDVEDIAQEVSLAIVRRNFTPSAYDHRLAGFSHYVWQVCANVVGHLLEKRRRWRRERPAADLPEREEPRDPLAAWEWTQELDVDVAWAREHLADAEGPEEPAVDGPGVVKAARGEQLSLFGAA